ncbi:hypothetical protein MHYP_G00234750 [Metynnis hypsauchen]
MYLCVRLKFRYSHTFMVAYIFESWFLSFLNLPFVTFLMKLSGNHAPATRTIRCSTSTDYESSRLHQPSLDFPRVYRAVAVARRQLFTGSPSTSTGSTLLSSKRRSFCRRIRSNSMTPGERRGRGRKPGLKWQATASLSQSSEGSSSASSAAETRNSPVLPQLCQVSTSVHSEKATSASASESNVVDLTGQDENNGHMYVNTGTPEAPDLDEFDISILPDKCVQDKVQQNAKLRRHGKIFRTVWVTGLQSVVCQGYMKPKSMTFLRYFPKL